MFCSPVKEAFTTKKKKKKKLGVGGNGAYELLHAGVGGNGVCMNYCMQG